MRKDKSLTIFIMLMSGLVSPIVFFYAQHAGGAVVQASVVSIKATIAFLAGLLMVGYDKAYAYHIHRGENEEELKKGFLLIGVLYALVTLMLLLTAFLTKNYNIVAIVIGMLGTGFFFVCRASAISRKDYRSVNIFTLSYYACNIFFLVFIGYNEILYFCVFNSVWLLFAITRLTKSGFFRFCNSLSIFSLVYSLRDIQFKHMKFGIGDFSSALSISAPAFFLIQTAEQFSDGQELVINLGFILLLSTMLRYPFSALLPVIVVSNIENHALLRGKSQLILLVFILLVLGSGLIFFGMSYVFAIVPALNVYSLTREFLVLVSLFVTTSVVLLFVQYVFLLKSRLKMISVLNLVKILAYFLMCLICKVFQIEVFSVLLSAMLVIEGALLVFMLFKNNL